MYGTTEINASGAVLATTGLSLGVGVLTVVGVVLIVIGVFTLLRRNGKHRP